MTNKLVMQMAQKSFKLSEVLNFGVLFWFRLVFFVKDSNYNLARIYGLAVIIDEILYEFLLKKSITSSS